MTLVECPKCEAHVFAPKELVGKWVNHKDCAKTVKLKKSWLMNLVFKYEGEKEEN